MLSVCTRASLHMWTTYASTYNGKYVSRLPTCVKHYAHTYVSVRRFRLPQRTRYVFVSLSLRLLSLPISLSPQVNTLLSSTVKTGQQLAGFHRDAVRMTDDLNTALTTGKKLVEEQLAKLTAEETERFTSLQVISPFCSLCVSNFSNHQCV